MRSAVACLAHCRPYSEALMDIQTLRMLSAAANAPTQQSLLAALANPGAQSGQPALSDSIASPQGQGLLALLAARPSGNGGAGNTMPPAPAAQPPAPAASPSRVDPQSLAPLPQQSVQGMNLPADPTQAIQGGDSDQPAAPGGLLGALMPAVQSASQTPDASKSLLSALGASVSTIGDKLGNLSPSSSQALLATGLTMLAGNDGRRNLAQLVGAGGLNGLNTYAGAQQQQFGNALAQQKLLQDAQQKGFDNRIALGKLGVEQYNAINAPVTVAPGSALYTKDGRPLVQGTPQVARTIETQDPQGNTYTLQYGNDGNMIGQPVLKSAVGVGPLSEAQQKTVNDAAAAAAEARTTYQNTTYLANQLASAPEFSSGAAANINDMLTRITGNKDAGQQLRGQLSQFVNKSILSELPPGSASDKDIALVRNGVPADNAAPNTWLAYLQAVGRVQKGVAEYQAAKADYSAANRGSLGPLGRDATVNGVQYPAGSTFAQATLQQPQQPAQVQQQGQNTQPPLGRYSLGDVNAELKRRGLVR